MMNMRNELRKLWLECFDDPTEWVDMYFSRVYRDDDAMIITDTETDGDGIPVSSMLLQPYDMSFHGQRIGTSYISGACTRKSKRGQGYMSALIDRALQASCERGDTFTTLIPAHEWLYNYYARFGFAPVVLPRVDCYTSLHVFTPKGHYRVIDDLYDDSVISAFERLEAAEPCRVLHSRRDYLNIVDDNRMCGGAIAAVRDMNASEGDDIVAMGFAVTDGTTVTVTDLMANNSDAAAAVLRHIKETFADMPLRVVAFNNNHLDTAETDNYRQGAPERTLTPRGMMRIVNVEKCLAVIAGANPKWRSTICVTDNHMPENNGVYRISNGKVSRLDASSNGSIPDLDIDVATLCAIVFSAPATGDVMGIPSIRPVMTLMLD